MMFSWHSHDSDAASAVALGSRATITFDDIDTTKVATIPAGYAGLDWTNFIALNPEAEFFPPNSGYFVGTTSGEQVAFSGAGQPCSVELSSGTFTLNSVNMTAAWDSKLVVEITGYLHGAVVYDKIVRLTDTAPNAVGLNFKNVDQVAFTQIKSIPDPSQSGSGDQIVFDDMVVSKVRGTATPPLEGHATGATASAAAGLPGHVDAATLHFHIELHQPLSLA